MVEKGANFQLLPGWRFPVPGFAEELVGIKVGEEREFSLKMPDTFPDKTKAGKDVHFKVEVNDVRREKLPELNDEFARKVAPGSESMEKLREAVKADLMSRSQEAENKLSRKRSSTLWWKRARSHFPRCWWTAKSSAW